MVVQSPAAKLQDNSPLVSTPATMHPLSVDRPADPPYLSPCSRSKTVATDEGPLPSPEQETAISDLKAFDELTILAWLTLVRSLDPSIYLRASHPAPNRLTSQQLRALVTLRSCHDDHVSAWLDLPLLSGKKFVSSTKSMQLMVSNRQRFPTASLLPKHAPKCKACGRLFATAYSAKFSKVLEQVVN